MLTVHFETEVETLKKVCADLGENYEAGGTFFVLREDDEPVGFMLSPIPLEVEGHIPELEKFGFRYEDGFMRIDDSRDINLHGDCKGV